jgi:hypothetical protein
MEVELRRKRPNTKSKKKIRQKTKGKRVKINELMIVFFDL